MENSDSYLRLTRKVEGFDVGEIFQASLTYRPGLDPVSEHKPITTENDISIKIIVHNKIMGEGLISYLDLQARGAIHL